MGRTRTQPTTATLPQNSEPEQDPAISPEAIATIAALLLAGATPGAIASVILPLLPAGLLARFPTEAARASLAATTLVLGVELPTGQRRRSEGDIGAGETLAITSEATGSEATPDARVYSALYAVNAARRLFKCRDDFGAALQRERGYLRLHRETQDRRRKERAIRDAMVDRYGPVLSWRWGETRIPEEPRVFHKAADKKNVDVTKPLPVELEPGPGVRPFCSCVWGPPVDGAETLT